MNRFIRITCGIVLALVAVAMPPALAAAQDGNTLTCGFEAAGTITDQTPTNEWVLVLKGQESVTITQTATSDNLDPYLILQSVDGAVLTENDDGENLGYNAQIVQTLEGGRYTVIATRFSQDTGITTGSYTISVACGADAPAQPVTDAQSGVLFQDDFSVDSGAWRLGSTDDGETWLENGELHMLNYTSAEFTKSTEAGQNLTDFVLTLEAWLVEGALDNWHHIIFRNQGGGNYYMVSFSADGYYMGKVRRDGTDVEEWAAPTQTAAIRQGYGAVNALQLEVSGNSVRFFINDILLIDTVVAPENAIASGDIGMGVDSLSGADFSEIAFDNLLITGPGGAAPAAAAGNYLLADDFSSDTGVWWLTADERGEITIQNGELVIHDVFDDIAFSSGPVDLFEDFVLDVDSRLISGTENNWHFVVFRLNETTKSSSYYRVGYSADGYITGEEVINGELISWIEPTLSNAVLTGYNVTNHIHLIVEGLRVQYYLNDQLILDVDAFNALPTGELWLSADALEAPDTTVAFDNLTIAAP